MRLGTLAEGGLAPAIMAIVERGVIRRPEQARALGIEVELRMEESYLPVRIAFGDAFGLMRSVECNTAITCKRCHSARESPALASGAGGACTSCHGPRRRGRTAGCAGLVR